MKVSELIEWLKEKQAEYGNREVFIDADASGLRTIDDIDVDVEETGLIIYTGDPDGTP